MMKNKSMALISLALILIQPLVSAFGTALASARIQSSVAQGAGSLTTLVMGINNAKQNSYESLKDLAIANGGEIVNTVAIEGRPTALVVELPVDVASSFGGVVRAIELATYVEPRMWAEAAFVPDDAGWDVQWGSKKIEADWAWNYTIGSRDVLVAIVDTGIDYTHDDLNANYVPLGYDWVNNDSDPMDDSVDPKGHGTHCAGITAAETNNSVGIAGLAQVRIMAEKVLDQMGNGPQDQVAQGIINATDSGADIISMSLGFPGPSECLYEAVQYAYNRSVLLVAAAHNYFSNAKFYPAAYDEVMAVSATDQNDDLAFWGGLYHTGSNFGDWIELAAPGDEIYSTLQDHTYGNMSGTSMACPHVSGLAALIWSRYPNLTRDSVRYLLRYTADDLGPSGFDPFFGYGRVNAHSAVKTEPPEFDLVALGLDVPPIVHANISMVVRGTVLNLGSESMDNVTVHLLENGVSVDDANITVLPGGSSSVIDFSWTPPVGMCDLTLYVVHKPIEENGDNNSKIRNVTCRFPTVLSVPSANYTSIQAALDATIPKDTVNVSDGTYDGCIFIYTSDVRLIGTGSTIIQSVRQNEFAINIGADNVTVSGRKMT